MRWNWTICVKTKRQLRKIDMGYSRTQKTLFLRSLWNLSWEYKCLYMLFRTLFKWPNQKNFKFEKKNWLKRCARLPRNFENHGFQKIIKKKKVFEINHSNFDTNILIAVPSTQKNIRTIAFILKLLFESLRVAKVKIGSIFSRRFFFLFLSD